MTDVYISYAVRRIPAHQRQVSLLLSAPRYEAVPERWVVLQDGAEMTPAFATEAEAVEFAREQMEHAARMPHVLPAPLDIERD